VVRSGITLKKRLKDAWFKQKRLNLDYRGLKKEFKDDKELLAYHTFLSFKEGSKPRTVARIWSGDDLLEGGITSFRELWKSVKEHLKNHKKLTIELGYEKIEKGSVVDEEYYTEIKVVGGDVG